jgi:hypothetical protein
MAAIESSQYVGGGLRECADTVSGGKWGIPGNVERRTSAGMRAPGGF